MTTKKTTKKTSKKSKSKDYIRANRIKIQWVDDVKINKQNTAVAAVLLMRLAGKPLPTIKKAFCAATAQYRCGKKAATADSRSNGNFIYLQNADKGLNGQGNQWTNNAQSKIASGKAPLDIAVAFNVVGCCHNINKASLIKACNQQADKASKADKALLANCYRQFAKVIGDSSK